MKIVFICGSLEPGRDGVGDYVRQLAGELLRQGNQVAGVALNDKYTEQEICFIQTLNQDELPILRIPATWPTNRRFQRAQQWVEKFQPAWISLQFVPYAFQSKGLPLLLSWHLRDLIRGRHVHLMVHEAWVGTEDDTGLKRRLLAWLQKTVVKKTISGLRPSVIHTHLPIYRTRLQNLGWNALPLPLFSNIPIVPSLPQVDESNVFRIGIFSQADTSGPFIVFLASLAQYLAHCNRHCQVLLIGGAPTKMHALTTILEALPHLQGQIHYTGFLTPTQLSITLQTCHLGLTPIPQHGLGKSGTVAAFIAHGIPVAAPVTHSQNKENHLGFFDENLCSSILFIPDLEQLENIQSSVKLAKAAIDISKIANIFLSSLAATAN